MASKGRINKNLDSDKDGLTDWEEVHLYGTDPENPDTDGDGMGDGDEVAAGRNPGGRGSLKDIFIPHEGNDYRPGSLHPGRVCFHAVSAVAVKFIVIAFVAAYPLTAWLTPDVVAEQGRKIISLTNLLRKDRSLPALKENNKLDQAAYAKVCDMFLGQYFAHVSPEDKDLGDFLEKSGYEYSVAGENLAMGYDEAEDVVEAWKESPTHYANISDKDFTEIGVSLAADIFEGEGAVLAAQYFGAPKKSAAVPATKPKRAAAKKAGELSVLSARETKPEIKVKIDKPAAKKESIVQVQAILPPETKAAKAEILRREILLARNGSGEWTGSAVVDGVDAAEPVVPASITTLDESGEERVADIESSAIRPQKTSLAGQYFLFKENPNGAIGRVFDISSIYFKLVLSLAIISLILSVFIQIRRQSPRLIVSGLSLIFLLAVLIAF